MGSKQGKHAILRVCASCEWLFKLEVETSATGCPKCGFAHYSARYVYGDKAYRYAVTQHPWHRKKMADYSYHLQSEIQQSTAHRAVKPRSILCLNANLKATS